MALFLACSMFLAQTEAIQSCPGLHGIPHLEFGWVLCFGFIVYFKMRIGLSLVRGHPVISEYKFFISVTYFILSPARMPFFPSSSRCYTSVYLIRTCTTIRKGPSSVLLPLLLLSFLFSSSLLYCPPLKWLSTHLHRKCLYLIQDSSWGFTYP